MTVAPTDQQNPTPEGTSGQKDPAGQTGAPTPDAGSAAPSTEQQSKLVQLPQHELDAKFGQTRDEGRLSVAKANGFETVEEMNSAIAEFKQYKQSQLTKEQKMEQDLKAARTESTKAGNELRRLRVENQTTSVALELGVDPKQLAAVNKLRDAAEGEVDAQGNVNPEAIRTSVAAVLETYPWLKGGKTTINGGSNPPVDGETPTIHEQIAQAQKDGDTLKVIQLQMQLANTPQ